MIRLFTHIYNITIAKTTIGIKYILHAFFFLLFDNMHCISTTIIFFLANHNLC